MQDSEKLYCFCMSIQQLSLTFRLQHLNAVKIGSAFLCGNWSLAQDEEQQSSYSFIVDHSFSRITQADREEYWKIPCEIYACDSGDTAECVAACGWVCRVWVYFLSGLLESWLRWIMQDILLQLLSGLHISWVSEGFTSMGSAPATASWM